MAFNRLYSLPSLLLTGASLFLVSGCDTMAPQWMPRGYTNQDSTPLSSPAISTPWDSKAVIHDTRNMDVNETAWKAAIFDLTHKMTPLLPKDGTPLNITSTDATTPQNVALNHYLSQSLLDKHYNLTNMEGIGIKIDYSAGSLTQKSVLEDAIKTLAFQYVKGEKLNNFYLLKATLISAKGKALGNVAVLATIPHEQ
jgi:hypothetical protein